MKKRNVILICLALIVPLLIFTGLKIKDSVEQKQREEALYNAYCNNIINRIGDNLEKYGINDIEVMSYESKKVTLKSDDFENIDNENKVKALVNLINLLENRKMDIKFDGEYYIYSSTIEEVELSSNGRTYFVTWNTDGETILYDKSGLVKELYTTTTTWSQSHARGYEASKSKKVTCGTCNGTGYIKFYNYDSALEAALHGMDDYDYHKCYKCNGKGYYYE